MSFQVSRQKQSLINLILALISQVAVVIAGLFLPFAIIRTYGSETNGLVISLQQIITYFTLVEGGLLGATIFALYKPLAQEDRPEVNRILSASRRFYLRVGIYYCFLLLIGMASYPFLIAQTAFSTMEIMALVLLIGVNGATQLWVIGKYKALLIASQYSGIVSILNSGSTVLYSAILIFLAHFQIYVIYAFAAASIAYALRAIAFYIAVKKIHPQINYNADYKGYKLPQKNDVLLQQLLTMLVLNSSVLILTFAKSPMAAISIFAVYNLVLVSLNMIMDSINFSITAGFGNLIASGDMGKLKKTYKEFEVMFQMLWTWMFSCLAVLYLPFIRVYTLRVTDAQYVLPNVCLLFTLIGAIWAIRNQQLTIITAAGKFREIRNGNIIEALLTVIFSIIGFKLFGLVGILASRLLVTVCRAFDFILYSNKYILKMPREFTFGQIGISAINVILFYGIASLAIRSYPDTFLSWTMEAVLCAIVSTVFTLFFRLTFDYRTTILVLKRFRDIVKFTLSKSVSENL